MRLPLVSLTLLVSWTTLLRKLGLSRPRRAVTTAQLKREARACLGYEQLEDRNMLSGFSIGDAVSVGESGSLAFAVSLSHASCRPITVHYETADGTAKAGEDYTATSGTLTFARGETSKQVLVPLLDDSIVETAETFTLRLLKHKCGKSRTRDEATGAITDDDSSPGAGLPTVGFDPTSLTANEGAGTANLTVKVSGPEAQQTVTVHYASTDNSAQAGADYQGVSGELSFTPGEREKTIAVPITDDSDEELAERFAVALSSPTNASLGAGTATVTIQDDDAPGGQPSLSINDVTVSESAGTAQFTVSLSAPASQAVTVLYATIEHTAHAGDDFTAVTNRSLLFATGETQKTVSIAINNDNLDEPTEHFHVVLVSATGATIADNEGDADIEDDDAPPTIGFDPANLIVGEGASTAQLTVKLTGNETAQTVTAQFTTSDHTATADVDFATTSTNLTFLPGERTQTVDVPIFEDDLADDAEHFHGVLSNIAGAMAGETSVEVVIADDDGPGGSGGDEENGPLTLGFDPSNLIVSEGAGFARLTIKLTGAPTTQTVTASLATTAHTAVAGQDYTATTTSLSFAPGERVKTVDVPILEDTIQDNAEHFHAVLFNIVNAAAGETSVEVVISDNDATSLAGFAALSGQQATNVEESTNLRLSAAAASISSQDYPVQESVEEDDDPPSTPESPSHSADCSGRASKVASEDKETGGDRTADDGEEEDWHGRRDRLDKEHIGHERLGQIAEWLKGIFRHWHSEREHSGDWC